MRRTGAGNLAAANCVVAPASSTTTLHQSGRQFPVARADPRAFADAQPEQHARQHDVQQHEHHGHDGNSTPAQAEPRLAAAATAAALREPDPARGARMRPPGPDDACRSWRAGRPPWRPPPGPRRAGIDAPSRGAAAAVHRTDNSTPRSVLPAPNSGRPSGRMRPRSSGMANRLPSSRAAAIGAKFAIPSNSRMRSSCISRTRRAGTPGGAPRPALPGW